MPVNRRSVSWVRVGVGEMRDVQSTIYCIRNSIVLLYGWMQTHRIKYHYLSKWGRGGRWSGGTSFPVSLSTRPWQLLSVRGSSDS